MTPAVATLVMLPSTTASCERAFSGLRRLKTYLRSTMGQERLNSISMANVHTDLLDDIKVVSVANEFTSKNVWKLFCIVLIFAEPHCCTAAVSAILNFILYPGPPERFFSRGADFLQAKAVASFHTFLGSEIFFAFFANS